MELKTQNGKLSTYGFACGYVERIENGDNRATLSQEHGAYTVKGFKDGVHFNQAFRTLAEARKFFNQTRSN